VSGLRVLSRACPECGRPLRSVAGVRLLHCDRCPVAVDASLEATRRLPTVRPDGPAADASLPFFFFRVDTAQGLARVWVPAFRILRTNLGADDVAQRLSRYDPLLVPAPIAAPCGRDLAGAAELVRARLGIDAIPEPWDVRLVAMPCDVSGRDVHEREGGWRFAAHELWPPPVETLRPPALRPSSAIAYRHEDRAAREARLKRERIEWARQHMR
jgi:hypothetical protein